MRSEFGAQKLKLQLFKSQLFKSQLLKRALRVNVMIQDSFASEISAVPGRSKRYRWSVVGVTLAIAIGGASWVALRHYAESAAIDAEVEQAAEPLVKTVTALGRLQPKGDIVNLSAPASAGNSPRVAALNKRAGEAVAKGEVVAILDGLDRLNAAVAEAKSQVAIAETRLKQVRAGAKVGEVNAQRAEIERIRAQVEGDVLEQQQAIARLEVQLNGDVASQQANLRRLKSTLAVAAKDYERYRHLHQKGAVSDSAFESRRLTFETTRQDIRAAEAILTQTQQTAARQLKEAQVRLKKLEVAGQQQIRQAKEQLKRVAEVRPVDIDLAVAEVESAKANLKQAQVNVEDAYVRSPQDGVILEVLARPGEVIDSTGIVEIGQTNNMYAVAEIYQSDIFKIKPGQTATITSDSIDGTLTGTVDWVESKIRRQNVVSADPTDNIDARVVEVHIHLDPKSSQRVKHLTNLQVKTVIDL